MYKQATTRPYKTDQEKEWLFTECKQDSTKHQNPFFKPADNLRTKS